MNNAILLIYFWNIKVVMHNSCKINLSDLSSSFGFESDDGAKIEKLFLIFDWFFSPIFLKREKYSNTIINLEWITII